MFQSAVNKLTAWYVAALIVVVLIFSLLIFGIASNRLERSSRRQNEIFQQIPNGPGGVLPPESSQRRQRVVEEERQQLLLQIIFIDIAVVAIGAIASYYFARRTIWPIEEAHNAQARFTADASHQLRTPLATMQSEIEVALRDKKAGKKELSQTLSSNLEEIARLKNLSDQLLMLTRIDSKLFSASRFSFDKSVSKRVVDLQKQYGISIQSEITTKIIVTGDEPLLAELATILIDNAVKYADHLNPKVTVHLSKKSNNAVLKVSNNGKGIASNELPNIFDRFYRGKHSAAGTNGHGLGLALASEIVSKHAGHISVKSDSKKTEFTVYIPLAK